MSALAVVILPFSAHRTPTTDPSAPSRTGYDRVPWDSGKPYIGRTKQASPEKRGNQDGRDRSDAEVVDTYEPSDAAAGRRAEQKAMNREGGFESLDNKRNEIKQAVGRLTA